MRAIGLVLLSIAIMALLLTDADASMSSDLARKPPGGGSNSTRHLKHAQAERGPSITSPAAKRSGYPRCW